MEGYRRIRYTVLKIQKKTLLLHKLRDGTIRKAGNIQYEMDQTSVFFLFFVYPDHWWSFDLSGI